MHVAYDNAPPPYMIFVEKSGSSMMIRIFSASAPPSLSTMLKCVGLFGFYAFPLKDTVCTFLTKD